MKVSKKLIDSTTSKKFFRHKSCKDNPWRVLDATGFEFSQHSAGTNPNKKSRGKTNGRRNKKVHKLRVFTKKTNTDLERSSC